MQRSLVPTFTQIVGSKKPKKTGPSIAHTTVINLDNSRGRNDLIDVQLVYIKYGDTKILSQKLISKVKMGKTATVTLKPGTNPAAFFIMWKLGNTYDWFGDGEVGHTIYEEISAEWGYIDLAGVIAQDYSCTANGSSP